MPPPNLYQERVEEYSALSFGVSSFRLPFGFAQGSAQRPLLPERSRRERKVAKNGLRGESELLWFWVVDKLFKWNIYLIKKNV